MVRNENPNLRGRFIKSPQDFCGALFLLAVALISLWLVAPLSEATGFQMGTGTAPRLFAVFLAATSAVVIVRSFFFEGLPIQGFALRGPLTILGSVIFFALAIRPLGFALTAFVTTLIASFASSEVRVREALVFSFGLAVFCCLVFIYAIRLPFSLWPAW